MDFAKPLGLAVTTLLVLAYLARRRRQKTTIDKLLGRPCRANLKGLQPEQFTACVYELLRQEGHAPRRLRLANRNLLLARTARGTTLVQCRFWTGALLGDNQLRDFVRQMRKSGANHGILVTAGEVSDGLASRARTADVELMDGDCVLKRMLALGHSNQKSPQWR